MKNIFSKFSTGKSFSRQSLFFVLAILFFLILGAFVVFNFVFIASAFNKALIQNAVPPANLKFDIEGFEKLNLIQK